MVPENNTGQTRQVTRFQKVASALDGDKQADTVPTAGPDDTHSDSSVPDSSAPDSAPEAARDYWDDETSATTPDRPVAVTQPDGLAADPPPDPPAGQQPTGGDDHAATLPDVFGTTTHPNPPDLAPTDLDRAAATGPEAPAPAKAAAEAGPRPGQDADWLGDMAYGQLIPEAEEFRTRWHQIQFKFVDDPPGSVTEAADVVAQVSTRLEAAIQERQRVIQERQRALRDQWSEGANADTETLRNTLRIYRGFLDQLLGSSWGPGR